MRKATKPIWLASVLLVLMMPALRPGLVGAQPAYRSSAEYDFGQEMRFFLAATDVPELTAITLFFRTPEAENAFYDQVDYDGSTPVSLMHAIDLRQVRLAPFTLVTYWWVLTTADGATLSVPEQTVRYDDDQFAWRADSRDGVTVHWTGGDDGLGQLALDIVHAAADRLQPLLPAADLAGLRLFLYPSSADLRAALRLTGRDWVGAHAHPELGVLLVTAVNPRTAATDLRQSIPHELVHYLLYQRLPSQYSTLPAWFNEGLATWAEATPNPNYETVLAAAVAEQTTLPLAQLCPAFPADERTAVLAYAESGSVIGFVQTRYGTQRLRQMIETLADGADCNTVVSRALDTSLAELNQAWLRSQQVRSPLVQFWLENGLWFLLVLAGFGFTALLIWPVTKRT